ncbi:TRAP transporter large permease [Marinovum sp. 2_MG-2023]|uniref:TRAP transporter large permease n=1 Tax=unclassified Marinovum TaxID=2647166 RepID=UPI0026E1F6B2|nr:MULTISPECIES: TRAP transporter large permease [unclassified Marinovum]MDO6730873.1 TRAP transporter large permease [Marinovum sp. 2_MG-2023]MDO6780100.1 TRAP transporter large permease [Marinovum sp. 1_MG-2023]
MDPVSIFILIVAVFFGLIFLCVPIFAALGVASILGFILHGGFASLETIPDILHRGLSSYSLLAVPLFILMGEVMARTSIGSRLFNMFALWTDRLPGGLGVASVASSAVFGAMSGVSVAGAATIGRFAIPEMLARGYRPSLAGGTVAAAGALALLIPPSIGFVLYGEVAGQSVGKLFLAAVLPAVLLTALMMTYVVVLSAIYPDMAPRHATRCNWRDRWRSLLDIWAAVTIVLLVLGTIYFGIATPTEAAGIGALGAFGVAALYREMTFTLLRDVLRSTAVTSVMILLILAAALMFGYVMTRLMVPQKIVMMVVGIDQPKWVILAMVLVFLVLIGMVLDIVSIIVITTPVLLPVITALGIDPIWFGVVLILTCEMAVITPPVGLNLYVIKGIAPDLSIGQIIRGALPFVGIELLAILILIAFPQIALYLPSLR